MPAEVSRGVSSPGVALASMWVRVLESKSSFNSTAEQSLQSTKEILQIKIYAVYNRNIPLTHSNKLRGDYTVITQGHNAKATPQPVELLVTG